MASRFELATPRLILVGADQALLSAELESCAALASNIDATVPAAWPPEYHDRNTIEWVMRALESFGPREPWRMFYIVLSNPRTLVGTCGFKQGPDANGCVEIGYTVLEEFRRRGIASEAATKLISTAFALGALEVAAETYPALTASLRVMEKCGMTKVGEGSEPGTIRYSKRL